MENKADLTPLYAILQAKESDSERPHSTDNTFDHGKNFFQNSKKVKSAGPNFKR